MKTTCLLPYCPLPIDSGAKSIFYKHIRFLNDIGDCRIMSAHKRPVGFGWTEKALSELKGMGLKVELTNRSTWGSLARSYGMLYALVFKLFKLEKAFGHSNPYHRYAFDQDWFSNETKGCDLCEIHYSYWAYLQAECPKVVIIHDLWSDIMWEGEKKESEELEEADLLVTVSYEDKVKLESRGHNNVHWSPPCVDSIDVADSRQIGIIGSDNRHNVEGVKWLLKDKVRSIPADINSYGGISRYMARDRRFRTRIKYGDSLDPYRECGIILMLTATGTGLQIKGVEALASGRVVIARKGAMRGFPAENKGWIEVESRDELFDTMEILYKDEDERKKYSKMAKDYYMEFLEKQSVLQNLKLEYEKLVE